MPRAWLPAPAGRCLESSQRRPREVPPISCKDTRACWFTAVKFQQLQVTLASDRLRRRFQSSKQSDLAFIRPVRPGWRPDINAVTTSATREAVRSNFLGESAPNQVGIN